MNNSPVSPFKCDLPLIFYVNRLILFFILAGCIYLCTVSLVDIRILVPVILVLFVLSLNKNYYTLEVTEDLLIIRHPSIYGNFFSKTFTYNLSEVEEISFVAGKFNWLALLIRAGGVFLPEAFMRPRIKDQSFLLLTIYDRAEDQTVRYTYSTNWVQDENFENAVNKIEKGQHPPS
jgi:hypothetical protein